VPVNHTVFTMVSWQHIHVASLTTQVVPANRTIFIAVGWYHIRIEY
jgi:hypothetical protein